MDPETVARISKTVMEILRSSDMDKTTGFMVRESASEKLGMDLSDPTCKELVRDVVKSFITDEQAKAKMQEQEAGEEEEEEEEADKEKTKEYDDDDNQIICQLSKSRKVTVNKFKGRTLVSLREYYYRSGKELPTTKGISLTAEQWLTLKKNLSAVDEAINKMKSRLD